MKPDHEKRLQEIEDRANAVVATDWAWEPIHTEADSGDVYYPQGSNLGNTLIGLGDDYEGCEHDCAFLENAHGDVKWLIERLRTETIKAGAAFGAGYAARVDEENMAKRRAESWDKSE